MTIKRRTLVLLKLWASIIVFISAVSLWGYIYFKTPFFTITAFEFVGIPEMHEEKVRTNFNEILSQTRFHVFPSNRVIGYPAFLMKSAIVSILPNTASIAIYPVGLHTLHVTVTTYTPLFKLDETRGITNDGIMYTELNDMSSLPTFFIASSTTNEIVKDGLLVMKLEDLDEKALLDLEAFIHKINQTLFPVKKIYIDSYGDVTLSDKDDISKIIFSDKVDINKVWSNLVSAIDTNPLKAKLEDSNEVLDYLDLRFGNKVFYKFTNGRRETIIKDHEATSTTEGTPFSE